MLTQEQLAERFTGLGGTDAAPALGLSPFKSPLELFLEKRERRASVAENEAMHWGKLLEPVIRDEYASRTKRIVRVQPATLRHPKYKFMIAHLDGVTEDKRVFEAKTARHGEGWGIAGTDEVPHHYLIQVQHYLAVTGYAVADVAVLIGGQDFRTYEVPADADLQQLVIEGEADFWSAVEKNEAPEPIFNAEGQLALMKRLYPGTDGSTLNATEEQVYWRQVHEDAQRRVKSYTDAAESAKAHLLYEMKLASRLIFPDGMQLQRKLVNRKGYTVEPGSHIDARFARIKE